MLEGKVDLLVNVMPFCISLLDRLNVWLSENFGVMKVKGRSLSKRGTHDLYE